MSIRRPAVADRFYPADKELLSHTVNNMLNAFTPAKKLHAVGIVSPHAGYIYSGNVCAETFKNIEVPETVIILGPNHHGQGSNIALSKLDWQMPFGTVAINHELTDLILEAVPEAEVDDMAHHLEHSLEVQVPFLQALQKNLAIVPIVLSKLSYGMCEKLADGIAAAVNKYNKQILIVASSDMNHYESRQKGAKKDKLALESVTALDPRGLYQTTLENRITMCGMIPVAVMLQASMNLGANKSELVRYTDSGEVSGDTDQVVGYAGAVIYKS